MKQKQTFQFFEKSLDEVLVLPTINHSRNDDVGLQTEIDVKS